MAPVHAEERNGAVAAASGGMAERLAQKGREALARHLADAHGELAMADAPEPADMAIDGDVVGRVGEDEIGAGAVQEMLEAQALTRVPTQQPMPAEEPDIATPGDSFAGLDQGRDLVLTSVLRIRRGFPRLLQQNVDLGQRKTGNLDIKLKVDQPLQFDRQQLAVPAGVQGQLVVGQNIGPALGHTEMRQAQRRNGLPAQQLCGFHPAVPGDDLVSSLISTGLVKPNSLMLAAICRICFLECVLAFCA